MITRDEILCWLRTDDTAMLQELWKLADSVRHCCVGDQVHLRGLIEISSYCCRQCAYCGLRADHRDLLRYRLSARQILACVQEALHLGYGSVVLQAGEDYGITAPWLAEIIREIKRQTPLAVTLSLGERPAQDLLLWKAAGADRYLLRWETSDRNLYERIHPARSGMVSDRLATLRQLRQMGYEIGSGVMVGIPGQSYASLVNDLELFRQLDVDMIGIGPFLAHPDTPLGQGYWPSELDETQQAPSSELIVYKMVALTRILCPQVNIPSTTALATINKTNGRELGLQRGANVVMPNLTPMPYRALYEIYPAKVCITQTARETHDSLQGGISALGRSVGVGPGGRRR